MSQIPQQQNCFQLPLNQKIFDNNNGQQQQNWNQAFKSNPSQSPIKKNFQQKINPNLQKQSLINGEFTLNNIMNQQVTNQQVYKIPTQAPQFPFVKQQSQEDELKQKYTNEFTQLKEELKIRNSQRRERQMEKLKLVNTQFKD